MPKLKKLVESYCGKIVLNLFAGKVKLDVDGTEVRVDSDSTMDAHWYMDANEFVKHYIELLNVIQ
jgi:hypothetical protein